jgi:adenylate cyclase
MEYFRLNNEMLINYSKIETPLALIPTVSFVDVLNNNINTEAIDDKIVFIGATANGLGDSFWTPMGRMMNGVEIHAIATETILSNDFIRQASSGITIAFIMAFAIICGLITLYVRRFYATLLTLSLCLLYFLCAVVCFNKGLLLNMFYPLLTTFGTILTVNLYGATFDRNRRNEITKLFGQYVSASVAEKILTSLEQGKLKMGGEEQEVTVEFADVRGFTSIANSMKPEELVAALNKYLSVIIDAIIKYNGVINKFSGDCIMAIWNTPTACPEHHILAIKAAMEAHRAIRELQQKEPLLPKMDFGIGINTGIAVAGNMGSPERLEYSVIGSTVNLASRLTSAAPGGKVWISSNTYKLVRGLVEATSLGEMSIAGKKDTFEAYEIISLMPDSVYQERIPVSAERLIKVGVSEMEV